MAFRHVVRHLKERAVAAQGDSRGPETGITPLFQASDFPLPPAHSCAWPLWADVPTHEYCGEPVHTGRPYCLEHCRIAFYNFTG